ncbi:Asp-tRNA(Asn)/Glu-tRNA(Gln) amidotransferase subunit GatC [Niveispirillum sp. BGYR6]|jgi:aspartyl-tRNA(Asn)/glutamyl-tRNA(Gln) amidotransferase subunit C|uniref:Asp-tRNA(Asn)/Glu-tRNA(Gln) amidotransferase subunit GatC n=1 Tax=Niveispirillum sp. BGYR6 TaxID=2971249 RepID=UPI0022B94C04|nr:Asp-tRNA(Asn)/Glu-tRNA(Gln) amidotransferase subunit GatC [Niveispirillum sp. BGYR6]MDG5494659.1 Asp-tRNA(Asn)/Glu-tRNA(Gln) amidotransferase subunit GatC [Niveispirillum sp. BGYR6]
MSQDKATLDAKTVAKIAHLARIKVPEEEQAHLADELNKLLGWVEQLGEVDTNGVEPMTSVAAQTLRRRPDQVTDGGYPDAVVLNATDAAEHFFSVPKVVE